MPKLGDATKVYHGTDAADKIYHGANLAWSGASWHTVWTLALTADKPGFGDYTLCPIIPALAMSASGSKIKVTFAASIVEGLAIAATSIVERSGSTADGTTTPTQLYFSGSPSVVIPAGTELACDGADFAADRTKAHLIRFEIPNNYANDGCRASAIGAYSSSYYRFGDYGTVQVMEPAILYNQFFGVSKIELWY